MDKDDDAIVGETVQKIADRLRADIDKYRRENSELKDLLAHKEAVISSLMEKIEIYGSVIARYYQLTKDLAPLSA